MALVLVQHDISGQIVELDEVHLAHPVLGPHYKRVRVKDNGKVYVLKPGEVAAPDDEIEVNDLDDEIVVNDDGKDDK